MRACVLTATGGLAHLAVTEVPDPGPPGPGQVRVAVQAAALNHLDLFVAQGLPGVEYGFPHIMGADGAGLVDAVGAGVTRAVPGERVLINPGVADYSCAACRAGEHPLCPNFRLLGEHLPGTLVEVVVENVGEATWDTSLRVLGRGGRLVTCGATTGPQVAIDLRRVFWYHWTIMGSTLGTLAEYAEIVRRLGRGELRPVVDRVYPLAEARAALERLAEGGQFGKIAIEI